MNKTDIILVVAMAVALIGMIICQKKQNAFPLAKPLALVLTLVVAVCGIIFIHGMLGGNSKQIQNNEFKFYASQMYVMAKYAKDNFDAKSALVIMDEGYKNDPRTELVIEQCKQFIPNVEYGTLEVPAGMASLNERMRASHFDAFTNQYPNVDVIITMIGIPRDYAKCNVIKDRQAKQGPVLLMIGYAETRGLPKLIAADTIPALVTIRNGAQFNENPPPTSMEDTFGVRYEMVTKENLNDYKNVIGLGM